MKHPIANITVEGAGHNPYSVVEEGLSAFTKRMEDDGHYQRVGGIPTTAPQRAEISKAVFDKATAYVEKHPSTTLEAAKAPKAEPKKEDAKK